MGCTTSKQPVCRNCHTPCSPVTRSYSMHVHHPPQREGDTYHLVALTSTTLGYLQMDSSSKSNQVHHVKDPAVHPIRQEPVRQNEPEKKTKDFAAEVMEAKTWSKMIDEKITKVVPRTPITTPPGEPETINAWELMEGLEDVTPLRPPASANHIRSFSFNLNRNPMPLSLDEPQFDSQQKGVRKESSLKPLWLQIAETYSDSNNNSNSHSLSKSSNESCIASDFDPEVISEFRKSLELLPPANPFHLKPSIEDKGQALVGNGDSLDVSRTKKTKSLENGFVSDGKNKIPPRVKEKLILYFTTLRGVRKTYEDCCHVRVILKGTGVRVDERDVSMHSGFKEELKELLGDGYIGGGLPKVFVGKKYIGGADEIRRLHEDGQLEKVLEGLEMVEDGGGMVSFGGGGGGGGGVGCEACGDVRFLPCDRCSGSCKIYYEGEGDDEGEDEEVEGSDFGFQRCPDCNENGLVRCPICCD